jgi:hypothetical protein
LSKKFFAIIIRQSAFNNNNLTIFNGEGGRTGFVERSGKGGAEGIITLIGTRCTLGSADACAGNSVTSYPSLGGCHACDEFE